MPSPSDDKKQPGANPSLMHNVVSLIGATLALVCVANIGFLILINASHPSPYLGILAYMILPAFLALGLILIPIGIASERRRWRKIAPGDIPRLPRIDLNSAAQRQAFAFFVSFTALFVAVSAAGSYRAYEFSDSVQFCGQTCHTIMRPEYTTYLQSPHARVACVDCHVGPGASWYVRSKLSGSYQVYAAVLHKYPRPIPTPVANLRPAQQTCEQCHWPRRFYGAQLKVFTHFGYGEKNTPRQIQMLVNIGGAQPSAGMPSGIHWHMNIANQITYIATDEHRQVIPWVQTKDQLGHITTYVARGSALSQAQIDKSEKRVMDCIDCHDQPSHSFTPPDQSVDNALLAHRLDPGLPFIKLQAVNALTGKYSSTDQAMQAISKSLTQFYSVKYPEAYAASSRSVQVAITEVQNIYRATMFPYMRVDWKTHPNDIGHYYFPGCFRCHDDQHVSSAGKVIPKKCDTCHTVLEQAQTPLPLMKTVKNERFQHPVDLGDLTQVTCSDCHTGASM